MSQFPEITSNLSTANFRASVLTQLNKGIQIANVSGSPIPVSVASGQIVDGGDVTQGAKADTAWTSGSGSVIAILKAVVNAINASLPSGTNVIGSTYSTPNIAAGTTITQATSGYSTTSGTLTAATRKYLLIQNTGANALYVSTDGTTPTATNGFTLASSGGGVVWEGSFVPNGAITLASTGTNYSILWA
jgi:hypothetical protein